MVVAPVEDRCGIFPETPIPVAPLAQPEDSKDIQEPLTPSAEPSNDAGEKTLSGVENGEVEKRDPHSMATQPTSWMETLVHLLRGNIGSGVFAMGDAFRNAGLVVGPAFTLLLAVACIHAQHILLRCARKVFRLKPEDGLPDFAVTVESCFSAGPSSVRSHSALARKLVNAFLCITQLGFCCVYFVFVATNVKQVVDLYAPPLDVRVYMALVLVPILLSSWIRSLKLLAPVSLIANILMAAGLSVTLYYSSVDLPSLEERRAFAGWDKLPLFFGTAIFAFEGIGLVLPLQNEMKRPRKFATPLGVLNTGMVLVTILFTAIGFLGYLKFGDDVQGSVTLNLPDRDPLAQAVKICVSIAMTFTYALQFYVPVQILWPSVQRKLVPQGLFERSWPEIVFRTALVFLTFSLAELVPRLGLAISLVGAVSSTALALLFPPLSELLLERGPDARSVPRWILIKDVSLIALGLAGFFTGTYTSLKNIIHAVYED